MRKATLFSSLLLALATVSAAPDSATCPFERAVHAYSDSSEDILLDKRQANNGCPVNLISCSFLSRPGAGSACCASNAICTLDNAGNVACCPAGAFCTGTLTSLPTTQPVTTSTATGPITGVPPTTVVPGPLPTYTPGQYISNAFYPLFPVLWLAGAQFPDANQCAAAYATCDAYYNSCTNALQAGATNAGPGYGVTVSAPGGGFTAVAGTVPAVGVASATSICSSLRSIGCPGTGATCTGVVPGTTPTATGFVVVPPASAGVKSARSGSAAALVAIVAWAVVSL